MNKIGAVKVTQRGRHYYLLLATVTKNWDNFFCLCNSSVVTDTILFCLFDGYDVTDTIFVAFVKVTKLLDAITMPTNVSTQSLHASARPLW